VADEPDGELVQQARPLGVGREDGAVGQVGETEGLEVGRRVGRRFRGEDVAEERLGRLEEVLVVRGDDGVEAVGEAEMSVRLVR
jgi:hypothetical protein